MRVYRRGDWWWIAGLSPEGHVRKSLGISSGKPRRAAEVKARRLQAEWDDQIATGATSSSKRQPLELLETYLGELRDTGTSQGHLANTQARLTHFFKEVRSLKELTPELIQELLSGLVVRRRRGTDYARRRASPRTRLFYLQALSAFFRWAIRTRIHHGANPVDAVRRPKVAGNTERDRRALTPAELEALLAAAPLSRQAPYLFAATTGMRRGELKQLLEKDLDLGGASVRIRSRTAKNRRDVTLPLPARTVEVMRDYLAAFPPDKGRWPRGDRAFASLPENATLTKDLQRARVLQEQDPDGWIDFHSLRVTYATSLARAGVSLQQAQRLLRHSTPTLTAAIYTKLELSDARAAVRKLDELLDPGDAYASEREAG